MSEAVARELKEMATAEHVKHCTCNLDCTFSCDCCIDASKQAIPPPLISALALKTNKAGGTDFINHELWRKLPPAVVKHIALLFLFSSTSNF